MNFAFNLVLTIIAVIVLAISGGFATAAAVSTTYIQGYDTNDTLKTAHSRLTWAAVITWIIIGIILVLGIIFIVKLNSESSSFLISAIVYIFLLGALAATAAVGILSAMAASEIRSSENNGDFTDDKGAHQQATIAAILAIIGFVGLLTVLIITIVRSFMPEKKVPLTQPAPTQAPRPAPTQAPPPPIIDPENCPALNINVSAISCDKKQRNKNLLMLHPDKNIGCTDLADKKYGIYRDKCT